MLANPAEFQTASRAPAKATSPSTITACYRLRGKFDDRPFAVQGRYKLSLFLRLLNCSLQGAFTAVTRNRSQRLNSVLVNSLYPPLARSMHSSSFALRGRSHTSFAVHGNPQIDACLAQSGTVSSGETRILHTSQRSGGVIPRARISCRRAALHRGFRDTTPYPLLCPLLSK